LPDDCIVASPFRRGASHCRIQVSSRHSSASLTRPGCERHPGSPVRETTTPPPRGVHSLLRLAPSDDSRQPGCKPGLGVDQARVCSGCTIPLLRGFLTQTRERCTAPHLSSQGSRGSCTFYLNIDSGHSALELEMVTSACDKGTAPTTTSQTGGFERLRLRPHQEPTCSLGTRRDTSRRCGGLAPVPSASVLLHVDARGSNRST
jgi:hypothetical protein